MRLARRAVRDHQFRGTGVGETLTMWTNVRRGEKLYIDPFKDRAHIAIDSSFPYEVSVMKAFAKPLLDSILEEVPKQTPGYDELLTLINAFSHFEPIDPSLVHPDALIREFIGGGSYHYK
jgi:uridine kinase